MADHQLLPRYDPEEAEEALSLRDLPLHDEPETETPGHFPTHHRQSSSDVPEFFEFFSDFSSDMCSADDVIVCGKLAPFSSMQSPTKMTPQEAVNNEESELRFAFRRRSESMSKLQSSVAGSNSAKLNLTRNCKSLDYGKLKPNQSPQVLHSHEATGNSPARSVVKSGSLVKRTTASKPRWYVLTFGQVKSPTEMELRDMKSRQFRQSPSAMLFPAPGDSGEGKAQGSAGGGKVTWKVLRALSCKGHASVAVTASIEETQSWQKYVAQN
ncbi:uncharacterized protein LOC104438744 [Eucalyptus grandis]|uniref:uncharacterized protein LOC104438744 n=1 Tax=Eucalyptus grandis TaxID=71139 RepID=UPI00192EEA25|nr:uncharacterized protein LOC104438744 [Eucalyptus grandis]